MLTEIESPKIIIISTMLRRAFGIRPLLAVLLLLHLINFAGFAQKKAVPVASSTPPPATQNDKDLPKLTPLSTDPLPVQPTVDVPVRPLPTTERIGVDAANQLSLTLEDAIALALQNNNDIDNSRINVQIAEYNLSAANGVYDPVFTSQSYFQRSVTPTSSTIGGAGATGFIKQKDIVGNLLVNGASPVGGGSYQAGFSSTRTSTSNQNATLNPQFPSNFNLTYTQPLFRGRRIDQNRRTIEIAKKNLSLSDAQFRQRAIDTIESVQQAYWDLVFALRNQQVQIEAVKQARAQLESNERLVNKGALAPIEIVAATNQVATFEQSAYTAQETVTRAENTLKTLMLKDRTADIWNRPLTPVTPVELTAPRVPLTDAVAEALKNRPEITQLQANAEINDIDVRFYRDQTKPQIDLVGNYTSAGLAGATTTTTTSTSSSTTSLLVQRVNQLSTIANLPPLQVTTTTTNSPPSNLVGGYFNSLGNLFQQDYPTVRIGVNISIPFRNRVAEANLGRSLVQGNSIKNQRAQLEQTIEADVRNALQSLRSAEARLDSATIARTSAEQQYESEQRQFRAGTSTIYLVLQRQTNLLTARSNELQAQTTLNKAISTFQRAVGTTLSANNVSINDGSNAPKTYFRPKTDFTLSAARRYFQTTNQETTTETTLQPK